MIKSVGISNLTSFSADSAQGKQAQKFDLSGLDSNKNMIMQYLNATSVVNQAAVTAPQVQNVQNAPAQTVSNYKNNLKSMINNNESVILAIIPRTFNAKDADGNEKIDSNKGEQNSTFLSCIERLDEVKQNGFNTLHLLPIHQPGDENAMGTAGSVYAPKEIVGADGKIAIDPALIDKNDPRSPQEQFKAFIDACHERNIKVMIDLPSCASCDLYDNEPELMARTRFGVEKTPQGWADIRMFQPWEDESKRTLNPKLLEMHKQFVDNCIELGIDGIRADVARAKPTEFWSVLIPYSHQKDKEFAWLGETYTYECASPQVNMPYDRPKDSLKAGFDSYYGQYHIFHEWQNAKEFNTYVKENLAMTKENGLAGKSLIGSFSTHDDVSPMVHGGADYCNMTTVIQATIPQCNPYFVDGYQSGDYYKYNYANKSYDKKNGQEINQEKDENGKNNVMTVHPYKLDIFNLSRKPGGDEPEIGQFAQKTFEMRNNYKDVITKGSYIELEKKADKNDQVIAYARHLNGKTLLVVANKDVNCPSSAVISVPTLKATQKLNNLVPNYGEKSELQVADGELRVELGKARAMVFEIDTPNIEQNAQGHVFKENM
ncbi:hypothetical protein IJI31_03775 [bacterium]|nr:hypothetical protein [bacterium]